MIGETISKPTLGTVGGGWVLVVAAGFAVLFFSILAIDHFLQRRRARRWQRHGSGSPGHHAGD